MKKVAFKGIAAPIVIGYLPILIRIKKKILSLRNMLKSKTKGHQQLVKPNYLGLINQVNRCTYYTKYVAKNKKKQLCSS